MGLGINEAGKTPQAVYLDESGFTGSNLLHDEQRMFVYASIALGSVDAIALVNEARRRFGLEGAELKGSRILRTSRGRRAAFWLLNECRDSARVVIADKHYSLACKFFEYVFEPVLQAANSIFYESGFHNFVATVLFCELTTNREAARRVLTEFEVLMRGCQPDQLERVLAPIDQIELGSPLGQFLTFALCHRSRIVREIDEIGKLGSLNRWVLELTSTSLFRLLGYWGERFESLDVYCDRSKPLETERLIFDAMVNRTDKAYACIGENRWPLTFNLAGPIKFVDSHEEAGVQIADVLAAAFASALKNPRDVNSRKWIEASGDVMLWSVYPDLDHIDLTQRRPFVNAMVLQELHRRTLKGESLLDGMQDFIGAAGRMFDECGAELVKRS